MAAIRQLVRMAWQVSYPVCILVMSTSTHVITDKSIRDMCKY